jgi:hypothetical protein
MSTFNLAIVLGAIGVIIVACLSGICSLVLGKHKNR